MITQEQKDKWIAALRSGDYVQGRHCLQTWNHKFCCLGVLCDVLDPSKWDKYHRWSYSDDDRNKLYSLEISDGFIPTKLQKDLISMNDLHAQSFNQIADYIEENLIIP